MADTERQLAHVRSIVQAWLDKQGHERCWYYPELFEELATVLDVKQTVPSALPPRAEFEAGCRRYQENEYGKDYGKRRGA